MRHADHRGFGHAVHFVEITLDLLRIDVVAAGDDEVFAAPDDGQIAVGIETADIAGLEPAIGREFFARFFGHAPIAGEHIGAAHLDVADLAGGARRAGAAGLHVVHHAHTHLGQGQADGARAALRRIAVVRVAREHDGLAHAVAFEDGVAGAFAPKLEGLGQQRRRARDEDAQLGADIGVEAVFLQQAHVIRRHAHHHGAAWQQGEHAFGVELGQKDLLGTGDQGAMAGDEQAVHMKERQRMQQHIAPAGFGLFAPARITPAPVIAQHQRIAAQIAVGQHRALAAAGGARGVQDGGKVVAAPFDTTETIRLMRGTFEQGTGAVIAEGVHMPNAVLERELGQPWEIVRRTNEDRGFGVADEVGDLGLLVGGVERQIDETRAQTGQVKHQRLDRFFGLAGDARAGRQAQPREQVGDHRAAAVEVGPGVVQRAAGWRIGLDRAGRAFGREVLFEDREKVVVHGAPVGCRTRRLSLRS